MDPMILLPCDISKKVRNVLWVKEGRGQTLLNYPSYLFYSYQNIKSESRIYHMQDNKK